MTSDQGGDPAPWRIKNPRPLIDGAFGAETTVEEAARVLEFLRDVICRDPDFGEIIDVHTRRAVVTGSDVRIIWTFDPISRWVQIVVPPC
jgi:hypothetical protein